MSAVAFPPPFEADGPEVPPRPTATRVYQAASVDAYVARTEATIADLRAALEAARQAARRTEVMVDPPDASAPSAPGADDHERLGPLPPATGDREAEPTAAESTERTADVPGADLTGDPFTRFIETLHAGG